MAFPGSDGAAAEHGQDSKFNLLSPRRILLGQATKLLGDSKRKAFPAWFDHQFLLSWKKYICIVGAEGVGRGGVVNLLERIS